MVCTGSRVVCIRNRTVCAGNGVIFVGNRVICAGKRMVCAENCLVCSGICAEGICGPMWGTEWCVQRTARSGQGAMQKAQLHASFDVRHDLMSL